MKSKFREIDIKDGEFQVLEKKNLFGIFLHCVTLESCEKKSGRHSFPFAIFTRNFKLFGPVQVLLKIAPKNLKNIADFRTFWNLTCTFLVLKNSRFSKKL